MSFRTRSARRTAQKTKRKLLFTVVFILFLMYATVSWILPNTIGGIGLVANSFKEPKKVEKPIFETATLAPPVLSIPFEATNSGSIAVRGYSTPGAKVKVYFDEEVKDVIDVGTDGSFTSEFIDLSLGTNTIYAKSVDEKDQESLSSKTFIVTYDNEKPSLKVNEPKDGSITTDKDKITISGTTDPDSQIYVNNTRQIVDSSGNFQATIPLNFGDNTITIKAIDNASNSTSVEKIVKYENASPSPSPSV